MAVNITELSFEESANLISIDRVSGTPTQYSVDKIDFGPHGVTFDVVIAGPATERTFVPYENIARIFQNI